MSDPFEVPCIDYKPSFVAKDLQKIVLKITYNDGTSKEAKCPRFTGNGGIEELLYVVERYENIALDKNIENEMKFKYFIEILNYEPRAKWMKLNPSSYEQDDQGFKDCLSAYYAEYSKQSNARDKLIKSLRTSRFFMPIEGTVKAHYARIETLFRYANKLQGTEARLTEKSKNIILVKSFPKKWKSRFIKSLDEKGKEGATCNEMISFMIWQQQLSDIENWRKKTGWKRKASNEDTEKNNDETNPQSCQCISGCTTGANWNYL